MATVSVLHPSGDQAGATPEFHRAGEGTPLVLLHGANMSWRAWRPVLPFLAGRHDVYVPTMAGHRGGPILDVDSDHGMSAVVDSLCDQLDRAGIAVSSGSSCTSDTLTPSHVLVAMGALTHGNLRISFGRESTEADLEALLDALPRVVWEVRTRLGAAGL